MRTAHPVSLPEGLRRLVAETWASRRQEELDAALRFARLADALEKLGAPESLVGLARRAAEDERRHAGMCELMARTYGQEVLSPVPVSARETAPPELSFPEQVLYEVVAACCISETESTAGLTSVLAVEGPPRVRAVLRDILRDEVAHSRLGWAYLAHASREGSVAFLAPLVPAMLEQSVSPRLFAKDAPEAESPILLAHGVLPHARKVEVFVQALRDVVFPGLERCGVDTSHGRQWAEHQRVSGAA
ncbi:ferritin-like domain-containing protein [Myxococcus sp. Y35]|uniref:ferritin-like domain-containing protein n=1 Tax=Pseudomyxococcus flavus TaxID=3115648 RepID=UPI003CF1B950